MGAEDATIESLRGRLAEIDRRLLELAALRRRIVAEIGRRKRAASLPTRDYAQEKRVIERARREARKLDLPEADAEALIGLLVGRALADQERERVVAHGQGAGKRALVIGGSGRMGGWLARFLASQGYALEIADPRRPEFEAAWRPDWRDGPLDHDLIAVAAPLRASRRILEALAEIRPPGVVFDVGSLKSPLAPALEALRANGVRVGSIHPMFGPATESLAGRHVIFVDVGSPEANALLRGLFASTLARAVELDLDTHDRVIAYVLGLSHALNIAFFTALEASGEAAPRLREISSTTFAAQLAVAEQVARENPHLYYEIQALNPHGKKAVAALQEALATLRRALDAGDEPRFVALMEAGRRYFERRGWEDEERDRNAREPGP